MKISHETAMRKAQRMRMRRRIIVAAFLFAGLAGVVFTILINLLSTDESTATENPPPKVIIVKDQVFHDEKSLPEVRLGGTEQPEAGVIYIRQVKPVSNE